MAREKGMGNLQREKGGRWTMRVGIPDAETLGKVLGAKSDRKGRSNKRRIGRR